MEKIKLSIITVVVIFILCFFVPLYAQYNAELSSGDLTSFKKELLVVSPSMGSFPEYLNSRVVGVDEYTGRLSASIALHSVDFHGLRTDISANYVSGGGIKTDQTPSSIGLGWEINAGGYIALHSKVIANSSPTGNPVESARLTDEIDWSSTSKMESYISEFTQMYQGVGVYDEYYYNFAGLSGIFYQNEEGGYEFISEQGEALKIEVSYINSMAVAVPVESQDASHPVGAGLYGQVYSANIGLYQSPYSLKITDSKGIAYTFGGTAESIEFSREGQLFNNSSVGKITATRWYLTSMQSPLGEKIDFVYRRGKAYIVNSSVLHDNISIISTASGSTSTSIPTLPHVKSTLYNPVYLSQIKASTYQIDFDYSTASSQIWSHITPKMINGDYGIEVTGYSSWYADRIHSPVYYNIYPDVVKASGLYNRYPDKLNAITVREIGKSVYVKKIAFNYSSSTSERLKLRNISIQGKNESNPMIYSFDYNARKLGGYMLFSHDLWGYNNGKTFLDPSHALSNATYFWTNMKNSTFRSAFFAGLAIDTSYAKADILTKITYPTKGFTVIDYEGNQYAKVAESWPINLIDTLNLLGPGIRVKGIADFDKDGTMVKRSSYRYTDPQDSALSSGILSYVPLYYEDYVNQPLTNSHRANQFNNQNRTVSYYQYASNPINPKNYKQKEILTYSCVSVVYDGGGKTVKRFKNYDNGYHNRPAQNAVYDHKEMSSIWKADAVNQLDLERGQVLKAEYYNSGNDLLRVIDYVYYDDQARFEDNGKNQRLLKNYTNPIFGAVYGISARYIATLGYNYYPYLKEVITKDIVGDRQVVDSLHYVYNGSRQKIEQVFYRSQGDTIRQSTVYVGDFPVDVPGIYLTDDDLVKVAALRNKHIVSLPLERSESKVMGSGEEKLFSAKRYEYNSNGTLREQGKINNVGLLDFVPLRYLLLDSGDPLEEESATENFTYYTDGRYEKESEILSYDTYGNPLEIKSAHGISSSYIWGYGGRYLVALVEGISYPEIVGAVAQWRLDFLHSSNVYDQFITETSKLLRSNFPGANIISYTYEPLVGVTSVTDGRGVSAYYSYDAKGRLSVVKDADGYILKTYCYNHSGQQVECGVDESEQPIELSSFFAGYAVGQSEACNYSVGSGSGSELPPLGDGEEYEDDGQEPLEGITLYNETGSFLISEEGDQHFYSSPSADQYVPNGYYTLFEVVGGKYVWYVITGGQLIWSGTCADEGMPSVGAASIENGVVPLSE